MVRCTMPGDEELGRVYHADFFAWYAHALVGKIPRRSPEKVRGKKNQYHKKWPSTLLQYCEILSTKCVPRQEVYHTRVIFRRISSWYAVPCLGMKNWAGCTTPIFLNGTPNALTARCRSHQFFVRGSPYLFSNFGAGILSTTKFSQIAFGAGVAQEWTNRILISYERTNVHFLVLPGSLFSFTEITEYTYDSLI